jgi:N-acyl-D-aspartate/D-glutamate deacylase
MDPAVTKALTEIFGPFFVVLACGAIPITLVFLSKHFKLRTRELELEAELHGRASQARLQAMETRLSAMEGALGSLVRTISRRQDLMQPPDAPQTAEEVPRLPSLTQVK